MVFSRLHSIATRYFRCAFLTLAVLSIAPDAGRAHELSPAIADIFIGEGEEMSIVLATNLEAFIAGIGPEHDDTDDAPNADAYDRLRALPGDGLQERFNAMQGDLISGIELSVDGRRLDLVLRGMQVPEVGDLGVARISELEFTASALGTGGELVWRYPADLGPSVLRLSRAGDERPFFAEFVPAGGSARVDLPSDPSAEAPRASFLNFLKTGFDHILPKGLDHVLFVVGLFLLSAKMRPLLLQVTTFTVAHSITLALGLIGYVQVPGSIVEPLIAASIVFVAVENLFTQKLHRWRTFLVFGFGLLHGLGFAGVLAEIGVPDDQFLSSLLAFNLGVELGQITVVLGCYLAVGYWFGNRGWYHARIVVPASAVIALIAGYWFLERVGLVA